MNQTPPLVLVIAGSDSGGGAGIQADLKTMLALGVHGMTVISAVTAQNSVGVQGYWELPPEAVLAQIDSVLGDMGAQAIKTGMLANPVDLLFGDGHVIRMAGHRIASPHTHGTGCTLASAIASQLAMGADVPAAVESAREYVRGAIEGGFPLGAGIGPVDHGWRIQQAVS